MRKLAAGFLIFVAIVTVGIWWTRDTGAGEAYAQAEAAVARAIAEDAAVLHLDMFPNLTELPPEIVELDHLIMLSLRGSKITNVEVLKGLTGLQILNLRGTRITDLSPVAGLQNLEILDVGETWVSDLSPLAGLSKLERLDVGDTQLRTLEPATRIKNLNWINLHGAYALDGSKDHYEALGGMDVAVNNGRAFREDYQPDWMYRSKVRLARVRARLGL